VLQGILVGAIGFEPTTPCAQGRCATRLRYAPTFNELRPGSTLLKCTGRCAALARRRQPQAIEETVKQTTEKLASKLLAK
jgi:hypothetical protein